MVREAMRSAIPPERRKTEREPLVLTRQHRSVVAEWLKMDREAPRKQRHTAHRIFKRLCDDHGYRGSESTVRKFVGKLKRLVGIVKEAFVPQTHQPGRDAEVDWYEGDVDFPWGRETVNFFQMRACYSGREFHWASPSQDQQALLEGHAKAFEHYGGVFELVRYDNLKTAVKKVLRGRRREETDRFVALRSHYLFNSQFCRPGKEGASEKGGVESGVGRFRRNHLVPVPKAENYEDLNRKLLRWCMEDDQRQIAGKQRTVIEEWQEERRVLRALPEKEFPTAEVFTPTADSKSRVPVKTNRYSVPVRLIGCKVEARLHANIVEIFHAGERIAVHEKRSGRHEDRLDLDHYLELLLEKPGAFSGSVPLKQAREAGKWPEQYDRLWETLKERYGESEGTKQIVEVLFLHRDAKAEDVHLAVGLALEYNCCNPGAIEVLLRQLQGGEPKLDPLRDLGFLERYNRPKSFDLTSYDRLLAAEEVVL
jgi:transposase